MLATPRWPARPSPLSERSDMDDVTAEPRRCELCGDPLRRTSVFGICANPDKPECRRERCRRKHEARRRPVPEQTYCNVCGDPLGGHNKSGICSDHTKTDCLTTPRRERRGFRPSRARVPVSPAPAPGNVRSRGPQPKSDSTSAGIGTRFSAYGKTCRIFCTSPFYRAAPGAPPRPERRGLRTGGN